MIRKLRQPTRFLRTACLLSELCRPLAPTVVTTLESPLVLEPKICYFYMTSNRFLSLYNRLCPS